MQRTKSFSTAATLENNPEVLAKWFRPTVVLHRNEKYFPCTFDQYLDHCILRDSTTGTVLEEKVNAQLLADKYSQPENHNVVLDCEQSFWTQKPDDLQQVPYYVRVNLNHRTQTKGLEECILIQYWFVFPYNGALYAGPQCVGGCCPCTLPCSEHQSDVEHISLYIDKKSLRIKLVYFSAHGSEDGLWCDPAKNQVDLSKTGRNPIVYLGYASHACYPGVGETSCIPRICFCANDYISPHEQGIEWRPEQVIMITDTAPLWESYRGMIGWRDHGEVPARKDSWVAEPNKSATAWSRLFNWLTEACCHKSLSKDVNPSVSLAPQKVPDEAK